MNLFLFGWEPCIGLIDMRITHKVGMKNIWKYFVYSVGLFVKSVRALTTFQSTLKSHYEKTGYQKRCSEEIDRQCLLMILRLTWILAWGTIHWFPVQIMTSKIFGTVSAVFIPYRSILWLCTCAYVVEEIISFDLVGLRWKSVKNWLQKWAKCEATTKADMIIVKDSVCVEKCNKEVTWLYAELTLHISFHTICNGRVQFKPGKLRMIRLTTAGYAYGRRLRLSGWWQITFSLRAGYNLLHW